MRLCLFLLVVLLVAGCTAPDPPQPLGLDDLGLTVEAGTSRPFIHTNKAAAFFYGEAAGPHTTGWQGLKVYGLDVAEGWAWVTADTLLGPAALVAGTVYPDRTERQYASGLRETITLLDERNALLIEPTGTAQALRPFFRNGPDTSRTDLFVREGALVFARTFPHNFPAWTAIKSTGGRATVAPAWLPEGPGKSEVFLPGSVATDGRQPIVIAFGRSVEEVVALADSVLAARDALKQARAQRIAALLTDTYVFTQDDRFNEAFAWTRVSMDALVMNQRGPGIFAGLPWFNNYWGRDSFIALPGALLVTGQYEQARAVLRTFGTFQQTHPDSTYYGRVPNRVNFDEVIYNTADGTPWFVKQVAAYYAHTGDEAFLREMWPVVERATEGALHRVDEYGFLRHGDQETWMDASAGPGQEWSPRGDRAVEIQALWYEQLRAASHLARRVGEEALAASYDRWADTVQRHFRAQFYDADAGLLIDHLDADGTPDRQVRPNQFFALRTFDLGADRNRRIARRAAAEVVYPYGVASLAQTDTNFHPYHQVPQYYPKDAAYHNGTIWTWLTGPVVSVLVEHGATELAYEQIAYLSRLALDRGGLGLIAENLDAVPREGEAEPRETGTVFQAWSHAEYLRNVYQDFVGLRYEAVDRLRLEPHLPRAWGTTEARVRVGEGYLRIVLLQTRDLLDVTLHGDGDLPTDAVITIAFSGKEKAVELPTDGFRKVLMSGEGVWIDGAPQEMDGAYPVPDAAFWSDFAWQQPPAAADWPTLDGPTWPTLDGPAIKQDNPAAPVILQATDPAGDDRGAAGTYTYPAGPAFQPGILDATRLVLREDAEAYYFDLGFAALTQPGWNPHYGFQLTFAALALDTAPGGTEAVGREAQAALPAGQGYEYLVYIGGGVRLEDATGTTLMAYRPAAADAANPLGSVEAASVSFRIPKTYLPELPDGTRATLFVGAQDDHGGAGLGDFRRIGPTATEWTGGGKTDSAAPNVYDVLTGRVQR